MIKSIAMGWIRHAITTVGGSVVASGWMTAEQSNVVIGAAMILVGIAWSWFDKTKAA